MVSAQQSVGSRTLQCVTELILMVIEPCVSSRMSDIRVDRQKSAKVIFFLVNSCLMCSASWMHSASSDGPAHGLYGEGAYCRKLACKILQVDTVFNT